MNDAILVLIGVFIGSLNPWLLSFVKERKNKRENANYLAVRIAPVLDKYISDCIDIVDDDGTYLGEPAGKEGCCEPQVNLPKHIIFPEDIDWKSIDIQLMFKLLSLPNLAYMANRSIALFDDIADPPYYEEAFEERQEQYAKLALHALDAKLKFRQKYKILEQSKNGSWNPHEKLDKKIKEIKKSKEKRNEEMERLW